MNRSPQNEEDKCNKGILCYVVRIYESTIAQVPACLKNVNLFAGLRVPHKKPMANHYPIDQFKETEHVIQNVRIAKAHSLTISGPRFHVRNRQ